MFKQGSRYITRGVNDKLPFKLHIIMWMMIDDFMLNRSEKDIDYLQVFNIHRDKNGIKIIHTQEVPTYKNEIMLNRNDIVLENGCYKIFVIDDVEYCTMMLAEEY